MMGSHAWLAVLTDLSERNIPCVLLTVVETKGSTPREASTKMVVSADQQFGTIGGGNLEFQAIAEARKLLAASSDAALMENYPLGPALAQCCGGAVTVLLEPFIPNNKELLLFGAGHVGKEVVKVMEQLPVSIKWIDEREQEFPADIAKHTRKIATSSPTAELRDISEKSFIVIMTHSHDLDYELVKTALTRGTFAYLGLIGSDAKRAKFEKRLLADRIDKTSLQRLVCPIGIEGLTGKFPREIAVSVTAQLLQLGLTRRGSAS
jgi:xanthine dehydrogenase accessory factor